MQLGLTLDDMAKLMGSSKAKSSLYENGLRSLNSSELGVLNSLELLVNDASAIQAEEKISLPDQNALSASLKKLAYNQKRAAFKLEKMQEKLQHMEVDYATNLKLMQVLNHLKNNEMAISANPYLALLEIKCLDKLKANGIHQQILIRHRLSILESEMASAKEILEEYEGVGQ